MGESTSDDKPSTNTVNQVRDQLWAAADLSTQAVDEGIQAASHAVKYGAVRGMEEMEKAKARSQSFLDTGLAHYKDLEQRVFHTLKDGVHIAREHDTASVAALTGAALLILPGPRRFLYRQTLGRLRSEQATFASAEVRAKSLAEMQQTDAAEVEKLLQRQQAAEAQYDQGLSKLRATARQLQSLASRVGSRERSAEKLIKTLRELPNKEALALRSEVAIQAAAAKAQRRTLEKSVWRIAKRDI